MGQVRLRRAFLKFKHFGKVYTKWLLTAHLPKQLSCDRCAFDRHQSPIDHPTNESPPAKPSHTTTYSTKTAHIVKDDVNDASHIGDRERIAQQYPRRDRLPSWHYDLVTTSKSLSAHQGADSASAFRIGRSAREKASSTAGH